MIYYATIYLKNGEIHLKPYKTLDEAKQEIEWVKQNPKFASQIDKCKITKKDETSTWFKSVNGYWI